MSGLRQLMAERHDITPSDLVPYITDKVAPSLASLMLGRPAPPIASFPADPGKIPPVDDPRYTDALGELANIGVNFVGPPMKGAAMAAVPLVAGIARRGIMPAAEEAATAAKGIRAYHGSPHDFDRFSLEHIGTGEGAQAYGHGLYFAENEGVAHSYRYINAPSYLKNGADSFARQASDAATNAGLSGDAARKFALDLLNKKAMQLDPASRQPWFDAINNFDILKRDSLSTPGHGYEVNINAKPEQFLDWDKQLAKQGTTGERLLQISEIAKQQKHQTEFLGPDKGVTGSSAYALASRWNRGTELSPKSAAATSEMLREAGIPGIKYLDQGSRTAGEGSRNYVVFDDKLIDILRKYGLAALMGSQTAAAAIQAQKEQ